MKTTISKLIFITTTISALLINVYVILTFTDALIEENSKLSINHFVLFSTIIITIFIIVCFAAELQNVKIDQLNVKIDQQNVKIGNFD